MMNHPTEMEIDEEENLPSLVLEKIEFGQNLIESLQKFKNIEGVQKLNKKINQELSFLKKIHKTGSIKKEHLQCSNLTHFTALLKVLCEVKNCTNVNKSFNLCDRKMIVDIVVEEGLEWIKVIARNPKSLSQICLGNTNYGVRSIIDQADEYLECAQLYPCLFQTPKITFVFANGIGLNLAYKLESMGVKVVGERLEYVDADAEFGVSLTSELSTQNTSLVPKVNLDISTLLAYTSSVTNGSCMKYKFDVPVLTQQAEWESKRPVKPLLDNFFKDKKLYCCKTAVDDFKSILHTVGGPNEIIRGEEFLKKVTILSDDATAADTNEENATIFNSVQYSADKQLPIGGKIKERSLIIFTFGDRIKAVTVTSNDGFVRAAKQKGINFVVFIHESRALTEQKETKKAILI